MSTSVEVMASAIRRLDQKRADDEAVGAVHWANTIDSELRTNGFVVVDIEEYERLRDAFVLQEVRAGHHRFTPSPESRQLVGDILRETRDA